MVVVGVGHGGLESVKALQGEPDDILLVDRNNYPKFQPLLYQVATAGLDIGEITQAARHLLHGQNDADVRLATVVGLDTRAKLVLTQEGRRPRPITSCWATGLLRPTSAWKAHRSMPSR